MCTERLMGGTYGPCRGRGRSPVAQEALAGFRPSLLSQGLSQNDVGFFEEDR